MNSQEAIILRLMRTNCRMSSAEIARRTNISNQTSSNYLKRISYYISRHTSLINNRTAGFSFKVFIHSKEQIHQFQHQINNAYRTDKGYFYEFIFSDIKEIDILQKNKQSEIFLCIKAISVEQWMP